MIGSVLKQFCLILTVLLMCLADSASAADRSIQNFVSQRDQWKKLLGVTQTLEGRISTFNSLSLRFRNCPIPFYFAGKTPPLDSSFQNVEVTGQLARENGRILFKVTELKKLPTDLEQFVIDESKIDLSNPRDWYALADWAQRRSDFYKDDELGKKARAAYQRGIEAEYRQLRLKQPEKLLELARRAQGYKLDPQRIHSLQHEALVLEWHELQKQKEPETDNFLKQLAKLFPEAKIPLKQDTPEERKQYLQDQVTIFQQADPKQRQRLMRWFYSQVVLESILRQLAEGGSNGFAVAAEIAKALPERSDLIKQYQEMQLEFDFKRIAELSRPYVLDLAQEFQQRGNKEKAKQTLENWIEARRKKLEAGDADGRVQVARDLLELTGDQGAAARLLLQAWELNPKSTEAVTLLNRIGYMLQEDQWLTPQEVKAYRDDPVRKAIRNGNVIAGMNREQVKKALGAPTHIGRSISGGAINELWIYGETSSQGLIVQLVRKTSGDEFKVIRIKNSASTSPIKAETEPAE